VAAVIDTPVDLVNRQGVIMDLGEAQALFAMPDEAHEIVVHARAPDRIEALAAHIATLPEAGGAEVLDWRRLSPEMKNLVDLMRVAGVFTLLLVLVAAAAGVANTMLMATFERTHEFGMLLALGAGPWRIVRMIVAEAVALGLTGSLIGAAVGVTLVAVTHETGVDYAALTGGGPTEISAMGLRWSLRFRPSLEVADVLIVIVAVLATSLVATAWPAARAARLQPARALRE
jgi:ABC-type lipoprotein release transport system permease subunit